MGFCWLTGHKINKEGICEKCGKTLCEIKGHDWIITDFKKFIFCDNGGSSGCKPSERKCKICGQEEVRLYISGFRSDWKRVK